MRYCRDLKKFRKSTKEKKFVKCDEFRKILKMQNILISSKYLVQAPSAT